MTVLVDQTVRGGMICKGEREVQEGAVQQETRETAMARSTKNVMVMVELVLNLGVRNCC